jgi:hypothetical protein
VNAAHVFEIPQRTGHAVEGEQDFASLPLARPEKLIQVAGGLMEVQDKSVENGIHSAKSPELQNPTSREIPASKFHLKAERGIPRFEMNSNEKVDSGIRGLSWRRRRGWSEPGFRASSFGILSDFGFRHLGFAPRSGIFEVWRDASPLLVPNLHQTFPRLIQQGLRLRPLFENGGTREPSLVEPVNEAAKTRVVLTGRAGEQSQMTVGIASVFVKMNVDDWNGSIELIEEAEVIISGRRAEVGVADIQTHTDSIPQGRRHVGEELVEVPGRSVDGVFDCDF